MKYIIDSDPGIDDAIAIVMAHLYKIDVIGYTLVGGNVSLDSVENNMKTIQDFMQTNIKMYRGKESEDIKYKVATYAHGKHGLGNSVYPISNRKIEDMSAEDFLIEASKQYKDNLTIVCFGALTNIANAIKKDKEFSKRVKHIVIMGASYNPNDKPYLEFNISVNPAAAKLVFNTPFEDMRVISHEAAIDTVISKEYIDTLRSSDSLLSNFVYQISEKYIEFNQEHYNINGITVPDPLTIAAIINPDVIKFEKAKVDVIDEGERKGESIVVLGEGNINFSVKTDNKLFKEMFKKVFY